jgi:hypothetical protein
MCCSFSEISVITVIAVSWFQYRAFTERHVAVFLFTRGSSTCFEIGSSLRRDEGSKFCRRLPTTYLFTTLWIKLSPTCVSPPYCRPAVFELCRLASWVMAAPLELRHIFPHNRLWRVTGNCWFKYSCLHTATGSSIVTHYALQNSTVINPRGIAS